MSEFNGMKNLQKLAGVSAISEALIYIVAFTYFGAFWSYPSNGGPIEKMAYLAENQVIFSSIYFLMYVVFGIFLAVLVVGLHESLKHTKNPAVAIGSLFGAIWVGLVIASGMISNIGLAYAIDLMEVSPEKAFDRWTIVSLITESLGGGNELVGGLWVLLVSVAALQAGEFSRNLNYLGLVVGIAGIATVYPDDVLTEIFGVTQIGWFIWLGIVLLSKDKASKSMQSTAKASADGSVTERGEG
jgi:hypothetical protein